MIKNICFRIIEDVFYQACVRKEVVNYNLPCLGLSYYDFKNQQDQVEQIIKDKLQEYYKSLKISQKYPVIIHRINLPWKRMFEIGMEIEVCYERNNEV